MANMNYLIYVLYVCIAVPTALMLLVLDKKNRLIMLYFLIGLTAVIVVGRINRLCRLYLCGGDSFLSNTTAAPFNEELAKGIPVILLCTFAKKQAKKDLLACAYSTGLGFAIFENVVYFCNNFKTADLMWALFRGIGAGLMHSLCTSLIAAGVLFLRKYKKLYWCGLVSFASFAMVYHGTYNSLVSADNGLLNNIGIFMPICTLIPIAIVLWWQRRKTDAKASVLDKAT